MHVDAIHTSVQSSMACMYATTQQQTRTFRICRAVCSGCQNEAAGASWDTEGTRSSGPVRRLGLGLGGRV